MSYTEQCRRTIDWSGFWTSRISGIIKTSLQCVERSLLPNSKISSKTHVLLLQWLHGNQQQHIDEIWWWDQGVVRAGSGSCMDTSRKLRPSSIVADTQGKSFTHSQTHKRFFCMPQNHGHTAYFTKYKISV